MKFKRKLKPPVIIVIVLIVGAFLTNLATNAYKESLLVKGYRLSVDGEPWFVVEDKTALADAIEKYRASYMTGIGEQAKIVGVDFTQSVVVEEVKVEKEEFMSMETAEQMLYAVEEPAVYYTVKSGDTLWDIAIANDIKLSRIILLNPQINPDKIWAGNQLLFEPMNPVLDVEVKLQTTLREPVEYTTQYVQDKSLLATQRIVMKKGVEGEKDVTYDIVMENGYEKTVTVVNEKEIVAPVGAVVKVGTKRTLVRISSSNFGVVSSGRLTSNFGWRTDPISGKKAFHTGIDIAAAYGSAVYSYASGTVTTVSYTNMRGYYITISHGNGLQTTYLHLSRTLVKVGQSVNVGTKIGQVGSTGYSTGNHLHFGVIKNGNYVSPWDYI
ncbi:MAG: peptidoglycan DD-metalloendopeptidase family protein [Erysipelotrichaceae bacterium]